MKMVAIHSHEHENGGNGNWVGDGKSMSLLDLLWHDIFWCLNPAEIQQGSEQSRGGMEDMEMDRRV